jgi:hypothetical protein
MASASQIKQKHLPAKHSPGGAKQGLALLMRPKRPLPTLPSANLPLRRNPNDAAAIIAARTSRGHFTSLLGFGFAPLNNKGAGRRVHCILIILHPHVNDFRRTENRRQRTDVQHSVPRFQFAEIQLAFQALGTSGHFAA